MTSLPAVTDASFRAEVEQTPGLVLVDFTATWCPPCRLLHPVLAQLAAEYAGRARIVTLDADENPATAARFGARSLPTVLFFRDGVVVDRLVGALPRRAFAERIESLLAAPAAA